MLKRERSKEVELLSRTFDHVTHSFVKGFNLLQIGWTDAVSYVPIINALLSSKNKDNIYCDVNDSIDKRTSGGLLRTESCQSKTKVAISMLKQVIATGICADYVLMDTWFTTEPFIKNVTALGLDIIGMVKQLKQRYLYNGAELNLRKLYLAIPNKNRYSDVICSVVVKTKKEHITVKIVYIRNRNCKRDYLALLSTDINLSDEEIVSLYARRWLIETNFRAQKQYFKLGSETYARSFDNSYAFVTISSIRYIFMSYLHRKQIDMRLSMGRLFRQSAEQLSDIPFIEAINSLMRYFIKIKDKLKEFGFSKRNITIVEKILNETLSEWFNGICRYIQALLKKPSEIVPKFNTSF